MILFSLLALTGCGVEENEEKVVDIYLEDSIEARANILEVFSSINHPLKNGGYILSDDFVEFKTSLNVLAMTIGSEARIQFNNSEHIIEGLEQIENHIENISNQQLVEIQSELNAPKYVYIAGLEEYFDYYLDRSDIKDGSSSLFNTYFSSLKRRLDDDDMDSFKETAEEAVGQLKRLKDYPLGTINLVITLNKDKFTEEQREMLENSLMYIDMSIDQQIAIMSGFSTGDLLGKDELAEALLYIENAREELAKLEAALDI